MRNTAPCVAYAAHWILEKNPEANVIVAPSDHLILNEPEFIKTIEISFDQAQQGDLVTLGIKPTRPDTGYGYIQWEDEPKAGNERVKKVKTFTEKPDIELAKEFLASGDFSWNSGIFIWKVKAILEAFQKYLPEMDKAFAEGSGIYGTKDEQNFINGMYAACENISIDYGIMEKAKNVKVVLSDFGWSDLGTWGSLHGQLNHDDHRNGVVGKHVLTYNCSNTLVRVPEEKLVVLHGLNGYIVVDSGNTLLVCKMEDEQKIKSFVNDIKINKGEEWV
jgi:mannose-1-phosphate guanylyltransferase